MTTGKDPLHSIDMVAMAVVSAKRPWLTWLAVSSCLLMMATAAVVTAEDDHDGVVHRYKRQREYQTDTD